MYSKDQIISAVASELGCSGIDRSKTRQIAIQFVGSNLPEIRMGAQEEGKDEIDFAMELAREAADYIRSH
jgi:hypothetical protein